MVRFSLKYRIAIVIFLLEAVVISLALVATLESNFESSRAQYAKSEDVLLTLLGDMSRIALVTAEFDELQPYVEQVVADPHVGKVWLADRRDRIVVSSDAADLGSPLPSLSDTPKSFWKTQEISNAAGKTGMLAVNFSHAQLHAANRQALDAGIATGLAGMSLIAVISVLIGHLLTRRLTALATTAQRFAAGDLGAKTQVSGNDEIAALGRAIDAMAGDIERQIGSLHASEIELKQARFDLERRVAERTAELAVARDHALEASRTKSAFLANMSHELRTPLNAIIGYSEILSEDARAAGIQSFVADLEKIHAAGTHLLTLINGILDLSKIEAGKFELVLNDFEVEPLIREAIDTAQPIIAKNDNTLTLQCGENLGSMYADPVKLRQALINLLGNAGKFTESGRVHVRAARTRRADGEFVEIAVADTGIGITAEQIDKLFSDFYQADTSTTRKYGGSGLGLAISRRFCQLMGGDIVVESRPDQGSTFTIVVPVEVKEPVRPPPARLTADHPPAEVPDPRVVRLAAAQLPPTVRENRRKKLPKVLVVDDDPSARDLILRLLTRQGFSVEFARDGTEALQVAPRLQPDVITLDVIMPGKNGWEVLQDLKKNPATAHIPVVMLTMTDEKTLGYSLGAAHFLSKPLDRVAFMEVLVRLLRKE
jgi:signal transduction histidine kinase/CheY-like chemotaxis protein